MITGHPATHIAENLQPSLKINDFLYFAATEHCMCWRPLYGSGLMWDFWLMFNRQPVSNCRAMTHREPAGYRTNTHTKARKTLICTSSLLPCSRVCVTSICMNHTHSIQSSGHPVCPDTSRLFLNCNLCLFLSSYIKPTHTTQFKLAVSAPRVIQWSHINTWEKTKTHKKETGNCSGSGKRSRTLHYLHKPKSP